MQLSEQLGALGIRPWLDSAEVFPGENWASAVGSALESSDALQVLVSPASADSELVRGASRCLAAGRDRLALYLAGGARCGAQGP